MKKLFWAIIAILAAITITAFSTKNYQDNDSETVYEVDQNVLNNFDFYCQLSATNMGSLRNYACAPDAYMMAANAYAGYLGISYGANGYKLSEIADGMNTSSSGTNITQIMSYNNDNFIEMEQKSTSNRSMIKSFIESSLGAGRFVMIPVNAYVMAPSRRNQSNLYGYSSPDLDSYNSGGSYYITPEKGFYQSGGNSAVGGHWILIVKLTVNNETGSGIIEYIDPLADNHSPSNRKYCSYTRLLDSDKINGVNQTVYDAIAIGL